MLFFYWSQVDKSEVKVVVEKEIRNNGELKI